MESKKIDPSEIYKNIARYLYTKYGENSIDKTDELKQLLKKFNLKRKEDYIRAYNLLTNLYYKNFNKLFFKKDNLLRIRLTKKIFLEIIKERGSIIFRKIRIK